MLSYAVEAHNVRVGHEDAKVNYDSLIAPLTSPATQPTDFAFAPLFPL